MKYSAKTLLLAFWRTIDGYEAIHMIRKGKRAGVRRVWKSAYCTATFSACSQRPSSAKFPIIYSDLRLAYKVATYPLFPCEPLRRSSRYCSSAPLIWEHVNPYGRFDLDMNARLALL